MSEPVSALWRTLHAPGHDCARVIPTGAGWRLEGQAVFAGDAGPCALRYVVDVDPHWRAHSGALDGHAGGQTVQHRIERADDGWRLDGAPQGLNDLVDLDFGFTPATNFQQLKRMGLAVGEKAEIEIAWFDVGEAAMTALRQIYRRTAASAYAYTSPDSGYQATLVIADNGFVRSYPGLWTMEP